MYRAYVKLAVQRLKSLSICNYAMWTLNTIVPQRECVRYWIVRCVYVGLENLISIWGRYDTMVILCGTEEVTSPI